MVASPYPRNRASALAVLCAMALMIMLDSTVVAVTMPAIQADLGFMPVLAAAVGAGIFTEARRRTTTRSSSG